MKFVSWNYRGLGIKDKKEEFWKLIKTENPSIILIEETKMRDQETLQEMKKNWKKEEGKAINSRGASGGIDTIWNPDDFKIEE